MLAVLLPPDLTGFFGQQRRPGEARYAIMHEAMDARRPIIAVVPANDWSYGGPLILMLKGLSDFPSWSIPSDRKLPIGIDLTFRTEQGNVSPSVPYPQNATIVWEDPPKREPLLKTYAALREAVGVRNCRFVDVEWRLWICTPK
jgi:hypothetical protein